MKINIYIYSRHWNGGVSLNLPDILEETLEPIYATSDPYLSKLFDEPMPEDVIVKHKLRVRKEVADKLAEILAKAILTKMNSSDTLNGYKEN